ncbi:MAG: hypothetical protein ACPG1A_03830 [Halioglobus sp.]
MHKIRSATFATALMASLAALPHTIALADDKEMIDANTERALTWIRSSGDDAATLLEKAAGVLVFPDIVEMGFGVGGEFGEGALVVDGETVSYHATAGTTFGMGEEAGYKAEVIFFMTKEALESFRSTHSVKVGEHVEVPVMTTTERGSYKQHKSKPMVGMVFSEDGVASHLVLDGDRITRIAR